MKTLLVNNKNPLQWTKKLNHHDGRKYFRLHSLLSELSDMLQQYVHRHAAVGRDAWLRLSIAYSELVSDKRYLVGVSFGVLGVLAIFLHLVFDESIRSTTWYYQNIFYYLETLRLWVSLICFSAMFLLTGPSKYKKLLPVFVFACSVGFTGLIHYCFYVPSFDTFKECNVAYHSFPAIYVVAFGVALGIGFIFSIDYLCYRKYHLKDGNTARIIGVIRAPGISRDEKWIMLEKLADEHENFNARI